MPTPVLRSSLALLTVTALAVAAGCSSGHGSSSPTTAAPAATTAPVTLPLPTFTTKNFTALSKSAAANLAAIVPAGTTKSLTTCPYAPLFAPLADLSVQADVTAANVNVNSGSTGGVDIVCETSNAQIAVGTYDPKVMTADVLKKQSTSSSVTDQGTVYVFAPSIFIQQPPTYVQYAWLVTNDLFVGIAVPPPSSPQALVNRLTALAPTVLTLTLALSAADVV